MGVEVILPLWLIQKEEDVSLQLWKKKKKKKKKRRRITVSLR